MELTALEKKQGYKLDSFGRKYHNGNIYHKVHYGKTPPNPRRKYPKRKHIKIKRVKVTKNGYEDYLKSEKWKKKRELMLKNFGNCYICDSSWGLNIHHLTYYRNGKSILGRERMGELLVICRDCHKMIHEKGIAYDFKAIKLLRKRDARI